jgi:cell division protein FtsN
MSTKGKADSKPASAAKAPTVSSRSAPKTPRTTESKALRVAVGHRYVQVGRYPSDAAARSDAARLKRAGLTVRMGTLHSGGSKARVLLAGPYRSPQSLGNALHTARRAGFGGAFTRK